MADPTALATLASVALLLVDKVMARCNFYDGVKTMHFECSKCLQFDISRSGDGATSAPTPFTMENIADTVKSVAPAVGAAVRDVMHAQPAAFVQDLEKAVQVAQVTLVENNVPPK